tara:strand:+ start:443 stop:643 length:201 start_codon:yes stop_codon:yes gene_type:complete
MKAIKQREMTLSKVISAYRKKGLSKNDATKQAKIYMLGYTAAKKGSVNIKTAKKWSKRDKYGRIKK